MKDKYLAARLITWAYYECDVQIDVWYDWEKLDDGVNYMRMKLHQATETNLVEHAYSVDDFDAIIKRMKEHQIKDCAIRLYENDHLLVGDSNSAIKRNFINTYCQDIIKKYCLTINLFGTTDDLEGVFSVQVSSYGHDTENAIWKEYTTPTCAKEGLNVKYCKICGEIAEKQVVAKNDVHTYCWKGDNSTRTLKCEVCPYSGIAEICVDGVWGYYDDAKAKAYVEKINNTRKNTQKLMWDDWGNVIGIIVPPPLVIDDELCKLATTRVIELYKSDFKNKLENEGFVESRYYPNLRQVKSYESGDFCFEGYTRVGVSCFCVDRDDSGFNFLDQYAFEFAQ